MNFAILYHIEHEKNNIKKMKSSYLKIFVEMPIQCYSINSNAGSDCIYRMESL